MICSSANVSVKANVHETASVWHLSQIREGAVIARDVVIGRGVYVGPGVAIGENCKIQNYALIYEPAVIHPGVFIGPGATLTNDRVPRAVTVDGHVKTASHWHPVGVIVLEGASIGANATCVAPLRIGRWAMVAAGSVVTRDVQDFELVAGVPARHIGWVGKSGDRLVQDETGWFCAITGERFRLVSDSMVELADSRGHG